MKLIKTIAISVLGTAVLICAGASADQPATRPAGSGGGAAYNNRQVNRMSRAIFGKNAGIRPPTDQEWNDMMDFMRNYSHARYYVLSTIPVAHDSPIALEAVRRWRNYVYTSEHFPAITSDLLRRFQLEDDLFELTLRDRADEGTEGIQLQEKIHNKVAEIVQLEFSERQARIDRLQKILADEKTKLQTDQSNEDDIVDRRTDTILARLEKRNPNLAPPTSRPVEPSSVDNIDPAESHKALLNLSAQPDAAGK